MEPLNKGPIGMFRYVPYLEVSFTGRLNNNFLIIIILTRICACMYNYVRVVTIIFGKIVLAHLHMLAAS